MKACYLLYATFYHSHLLMRFSIVAFNIARPNSPEFLSSVVGQRNAETPMIVFIMVMLLSSIFQMHLLTCFAQVGQLLVGPMFIFMFTMPETFERTVGSRSSGNSRVPSCEIGSSIRLRRELRCYRRLRLLTDEFNGVFAAFYGAYHYIMMSLIVLCVYGFVRTTGAMAIVQAYVAIWCFFAYGSVVSAHAQINRGSKLWLKSLRARYFHGRAVSGGRRCASKGIVVVRELRSLKELRIKGGSSAFYYNKCLILTTTGAIFRQSVKLLIFR